MTVPFGDDDPRDEDAPPDDEELWPEVEPPAESKGKGKKKSPKPKARPHLPAVSADGLSDGEDGDPRPAINLQAGELHHAIDAAIWALRADPDLYHQGGRLVQVLPVQELEESLRFAAAGTPQVRSVHEATLKQRLTRAARFLRYDVRIEAWVATNPPRDIVTGVAEGGIGPGGPFPEHRAIAGIVEWPTMRPDGTVLDTPSYDPGTGLLYRPTQEFPAIPEAPTQADAAKALAELEEVFVDFPFVLASHKSAVIAWLLSWLCRAMLKGANVPALVVDATTARTGKGRLMNAIATIVTGRSAYGVAYPMSNFHGDNGPDREEIRKILDGAAMSGASVVTWDNVAGEFGTDAIDMVLTGGGLHACRPLGRSEHTTLYWAPVMSATGNNIVEASDTRHRVLHVRLESKLENPAGRTDFVHADLLAWCRAERPRLVCAALTILRAWFVAGKPVVETSPAWGGFEEWSALFVPAVIFAGGEDPMGARLELGSGGEMDADKRCLIALLSGLGRLDPEVRGMTAKAILHAIYSTERRKGQAEAPDGFDEFRGALEELTGTREGRVPSTVAVGAQLRRFLRRVVGGRRLNGQADRDGAMWWRVEKV